MLLGIWTDRFILRLLLSTAPSMVRVLLTIPLKTSLTFSSRAVSGVYELAFQIAFCDLSVGRMI